MRGKLFVIEGVDGSGKATQSALLCEALAQKGYPVGQASFPNYDSPSSSLIKMYLNGQFGDDAASVNPYAASSFYAVDRFATFRQNWADFYHAGGIMICDRYTTSNMIHQGGKITDSAQLDAYLAWLEDFEYNKLALPRPDGVIFLDMPPHLSQALRQKRDQLKQDLTRDIHEADPKHLLDAYHNALAMARRCGWQHIACADGAGSVRAIADIHREVLEIILKSLAGT